MANTYTLIASNTLTSSAASVTFSAIPNTYTDLVLRMSVRNSAAFAWAFIQLRLNNDTSTLYSYTNLEGSGSSATSTRGSTISTNYISTNMNSGGTTANTFTNIEVYIPSYTASINKPIATFSASENNATQSYLSAYANLYRSTTAISQIDLIPETSFVSGSSFFLYGIKNS